MAHTFIGNVSLREAGEQVLLPPDLSPPVAGWKQVTEANYKDFAGCKPQVTSGRHYLAYYYFKLMHISNV